MRSTLKQIPILLALLAAMVLGSFDGHAQAFQDFLNRIYSSPDSLRPAIVDSFLNAVGPLPYIERDTVVHFIYRGLASSVTVPGDANGWSPTSYPMARLSTTDMWYTIETFETDARLDYKFVLNGSTWILDPRNPLTVNGGFGPNSELRMPAYVPAPEIQYYPGIPHGTLRDTVLYSVYLANSRTVRIYTPPGYESSADSFGVILFHDGLEYVTLAQANNVIDYLISQNRIRPIIAVFVPPVNRSAEYAGSLMTQFSSFLVNEVIPFVDSRYRTKRNPESRATLGASNGGNIALWLGLHHSAVFGNIAAQSSNIISSISSGYAGTSTLNLKLYLDLGTYDIPVLIPLVRNFIPILQSRGYPHQYVEYHEGHSWGNWRAHIDNALEYFFPGPALGVHERWQVPTDVILYQNYPNPFNPSTTILFSIPSGAHGLTSLRVYDILGREVATLLNKEMTSGNHEVTWDAGGQASGIYLYRMQFEGLAKTKKMLLVR